MESVKALDKAEVEMWQAFQQRFKISMGQLEAEMATMHGNGCTARPAKCRLCIFKTKVELLEKELKELVESMTIARGVSNSVLRDIH